MSLKQLKKAARLQVPQRVPDLESKLLMMLLADRSDRRGHLISPDHDQLVSELTQETNAVRARLRGDEFLRVGVDNDRVARVVAAYREAEDE